MRERKNTKAPDLNEELHHDTIKKQKELLLQDRKRRNGKMIIVLTFSDKSIIFV